MGVYFKNFLPWFNKQITGNSQGSLDNQELITGDAREIVRHSYETLMHRCATAYHENILIKTAIEKLTNKVIGRGLTLNSVPDYKRLGYTATRGKEISDELEYRFSLWSKKHGIKEKQKLIYRGSKILGDTLVLFDYYRNEVVPRIAEGRVIYPETDEKKNLYNGVYLFNNGNERALSLRYISRGSEVKKTLLRRGLNSRRLNYILYMKRERPGQVRGIGIAYPILEVSSNFESFMGSEVQAAKYASSIIGWLKSTNSTADEKLSTISGDNTIVENGSDSQRVPLKPGTFPNLEPDEELQMAKIERPTTALHEMFETQAHITAMAVGLPLEVVLQRFQSSYSASRGALIEAQAVYESERSHFTSEVLDVLYREFIKSEAMNGRMTTFTYETSEELSLLAKCDWQGEAYRSIDVTKDLKAYQIMLKEKLVSRGEISQLLTGRTYDITIEQIKKSEDQVDLIQKNTGEVVGDDVESEKEKKNE